MPQEKSVLYKESCRHEKKTICKSKDIYESLDLSPEDRKKMVEGAEKLCHTISDENCCEGLMDFLCANRTSWEQVNDMYNCDTKCID